MILAPIAAAAACAAVSRPASAFNAWEHLRSEASADAERREIEGISYLAGGAVAVALPFLATSPASLFRGIGVALLAPPGVLGMGYGTWILLTRSEWQELRDRAIFLAGEDDGSPAWKARREAVARRVLIDHAASEKTWRYVWGGVDGAIGAIVIAIDRSTVGWVAGGAFLALSAYHFAFPRAAEKRVQGWEYPELGLGPTGPGGQLAFSLTFRF